MSYYNQQQWNAADGYSNWDNQTPPARSGTSSAVPREDGGAFAGQFEEVDRATDNLYKSGKVFPNMPLPAGNRRDLLPIQAMGRSGYPDIDPRMGGPSSRHQPVSDFGEGRSYSGSSAQNFYAGQRHQSPRVNEQDQVVQAKRRMAAQRERELRNYHQEQQYNRSVTSEVAGSTRSADRISSPAGSGKSEDERRDLIARQRAALYSGEPAAAFADNGTPLSDAARSSSQQAANKGHGSPANEQPMEGTTSNASPSSVNPAQFGSMFSDAQQSSRTSASSPGGSPPRQGKPTTGVAPIGTKPINPAVAAAQRTTTPLPSPLSYGYSSEEAAKINNHGGDRVSSGASNSAEAMSGWGTKSHVWGKGSMGAQASVWG